MLLELDGPHGLMQRVVEEAVRLVEGAEGALIGLGYYETLTYVCGAGTLSQFLGTSVDAEHSLAGLALRTGRVVVCDDSETDERVDREECRRLGVRASVCVPLYRAGTRLGALSVSSSHPGSMSSDDVAVLSDLAEFISVAVGLQDDLERIQGRLAGWHEPPPSSNREESNRPSVRVGRFMHGVLNPDAVALNEARQRIRAILDRPSSFSMVYQPIVDLGTDRVTAVEALARFTVEPVRAPNLWFAEASKVGWGVDLELTAMRRALDDLARIPAGVLLNINASADTLSNPLLASLLDGIDLRRLVLELTEEAQIDEYPKLGSALLALRRNGARIAMDDTGAGYASLAHILKLAPDFIKLDRYLTQGIDLDPVRRALAAALVTFAHDTGAAIIAEGVETKDEMQVLREVGVSHVQGYYTGRPAALAALFEPAEPGWKEYPPISAS